MDTDKFMAISFTTLFLVLFIIGAFYMFYDDNLQFKACVNSNYKAGNSLCPNPIN